MLSPLPPSTTMPGSATEVVSIGTCRCASTGTSSCCCAASAAPAKAHQHQQHHQQHQQQRAGPLVRASMVDWMTATASALRLCHESLFIGVALLDAYLASPAASAAAAEQPSAPPPELGLAACACLAVAAKFEQAASPPLGTYLAFLSPRHSLQQLQDAELRVLDVLGWRVPRAPNTHAALQGLLTALSPAAGQPPPQHHPLHHLAAYLAQLTLLEWHLLPVAPHHLASACVVMAASLLGGAVCDAWVRPLTGCDQRQLAGPLAWLSAIHATVHAAAVNGRPYAATREYLGADRCGVAAILPAAARPRGPG